MKDSRSHSRSTRRCIAAAAIVAAACSAASADIVQLESVGSASSSSLGSYTGSLSYTPITAETGMLVVSLTNTSPLDNGGYLTGFVFNIDSLDAAAGATLGLTTYAAFQNTGPQTASPFGAFEAGAALGANWAGGPPPSGGIPIGATGEFSFAVSASDAAALSAADFASTDAPYQFVVRFRGFGNGGSDKVPAIITSETDPSLPAPSGAVALALLGTTGLARRRKAAAR